MVFKRVTILALVTGLVLLAAPLAPAGAVQVPTPQLTITGEPTAAETAEILTQWDRLLAAFPTTRTCLTPLTVEVVASAEAAWGGGIQGIAAFYRRSLATIFIEHGKVRAEHLIHEFAHHLDFSCGFGSGPLGVAFLEVQGFPADHAWATGAGWRSVPAEHFAEAVVGFLGIDSVDLPITTAAFTTVARFAAYGAAAAIPPQPNGATLRNTAF
ncbi:MAG TPA: hypothetical protein DCY40_06475 [Actinobacteria bacterium]|nr:hypothetical protein [Actinomycetota bacterium]